MTLNCFRLKPLNRVQTELYYFQNWIFNLKKKSLIARIPLFVFFIDQSYEQVCWKVLALVTWKVTQTCHTNTEEIHSQNTKSSA